MVLSGIRPSFPSLSRSAGQITHVLLTRSPLEHPHQKVGAFPFDLHVLSTPPAFVLSQDQTLQKNKQKNYRQKTKKSTKQKQTTNTKNHFQCPHPCSCSKIIHFRQMTHYRVLKQHWHTPTSNLLKVVSAKQPRSV